MSIFSTPQKLSAAAESINERTPMGTALGSAQISNLPLQIRQSAFFSARVTSVQLLSSMHKALKARINLERRKLEDGSEGTFQRKDQFIAEMRAEAERLGLRPPATDGRFGGLQDIGSNRRLSLIWETQIAMAQNYARYKMGMDPDVLDARPAQELVRKEARNVERDWVERWVDAGGKLTADGRMIALKTDPIWTKISRFSQPWPPFDFLSGMGVRNIRRSEAEELGLIQPDEVLEPSNQSLLDKVEASGRSLPASFTDILEAFDEPIEVRKERLKPSLATARNPRSFLANRLPNDTIGEINMSVEVEESVGLIAEVHRVKNLPIVEVLVESEPGLHGTYSPRSLGKLGAGAKVAAGSIAIEVGSNVRTTFVHEFGHFLDLFLFRAPSVSKGQLYASEYHPALSNFLRVVKKSKAYSNLSRDYSGDYLEYLQADSELWARAYTQYIATKTNDATLQFQLRNEPHHWKTNDFKPILAELDAVFADLDLLQD